MHLYLNQNDEITVNGQKYTVGVSTAVEVTAVAETPKAETPKASKKEVASKEEPKTKK